MAKYSGIFTPTQQMQATAAGNWTASPGAPTSVSATAGNTQATVTFTAPTNTGNPAGISSYLATSTPGSITGTASASPITVTGLTNGTAYTFIVQAIGTYTGAGQASAASNSVTPSVPPAWMLLYYQATNNTGAGMIYLGASQQIITLGSGGASATNGLLTLSRTGGVVSQQTLTNSFTFVNNGKVFYDSTNDYLYTLGNENYKSAVGKLQPSSNTWSWGKGVALTSSPISGSNGTSVAVDSSQNIYVTGRVSNTNGCYDSGYAVLSKYNSSGTEQWVKFYAYQTNNPNSTFFNDIVLDSSSRPVVVGTYSVSYRPYGSIIKFNTSGTEVWQRRLYNASINTRLYCISKDSSYNYYVGGFYEPSGLIAKYDDSGSIQWQNLLTVSGRSFYITCAKTDSSGNTYYFGYTSASGTPGYLLKVNSSGTLQWQRKFSINNSVDLQANITNIVLDETDSSVALTFNPYNTSLSTATIRMVIKYPMDGSITGSYSVGTASLTIASGDATVSSGTVTDASGTNATQSPSYSNYATGNNTYSTTSLSSSLTNL